MYAIIKNGSKQYKISEGDILSLEKNDCKVGSYVKDLNVLLFNDDKTIKIGNPFIENIKIKLKVIDHKKDKKIIVFKFKAKKNYRKKQGHRQEYTEVLVEKIEQ